MQITFVSNEFPAAALRSINIHNPQDARECHQKLNPSYVVFVDI